MPKGVGIYIGRNEVIAVSVSRSVGAPQIKNYVIEPINPTEAKEPTVGKEAHKIKKLPLEAQAIYRALEKIKELGAYVTAAVSPSQVVTRHFIMPAVPKKEEVEAIRYEASRYIPFKFSESVLDYYVQTTHKNVFSVTATAIRQEILDTCLENLRAASAKVLMVEPVYSAAGRAFATLNMVGKEKTHAFVVIQSDGNVNVTFAAKGIVYLSRDFLLTGKTEEDKTRFFEELKASIDYFYKLTGGEAVSQIFLAGHGDLKLWVEFLEHSFNYTIRFDVATFPNEKNIAPDILSAITVAYGLALRSLNCHSPLGEMKLLPVAERCSKPEKMIGLLLGEAVLISSVFLGLHFFIFQPTVQQLKNQDAAILEPLRQKDPQAESKSTDELRQEIEGANARSAQLDAFFQSKVPVASLFETVGRGLPKSILIDSMAFGKNQAMGEGAETGKKRRIDISGICYLGNSEKEAGVINAWVKGLSANKIFLEYFSEFKLDETKREKYANNNVTRFKVICE